MKLKRALLALSIFCLTDFAKADSQDILDEESWSFIRVKPFFKIPLFSFDIKPKLSEDEEDREDENVVRYKPNINPVFGTQLGLGPIALSASIPTPTSDEENARMGRTRYQDLDFEYMQEYWGFDIGWNQYRGFYEEDNEKSDYEHFDQHSHLKKEGYFANLFLMPFGRRNDDFGWSPEPDEGETADDLFSWTPVFQLMYEKTRLSAKRPFIPAKFFSLIGRDTTLTYTNIESFGLGVGFIGTMNFKGNTTWLAFTLGGARQNAQLGYDDGSSAKVVGMSDVLVSMRFGHEYSMMDWLAGLSFKMDLKEYRLRTSNLDTGLGNIMLYLQKEVSIL